MVSQNSLRLNSEHEHWWLAECSRVVRKFLLRPAHKWSRTNQSLLDKLITWESNKPVSLFCRPPGYEQIGNVTSSRSSTESTSMRQISVMQIQAALKHRSSCYCPTILCCDRESTDIPILSVNVSQQLIFHQWSGSSEHSFINIQGTELDPGAEHFALLVM